MLGPDALAWRDRHYGQSSCPQGRRRARENRGNRRNAAAPTPLFSRSQSDRAVLRKTQSSPAQVRRALHPRPLGSNRNNPPDLHSRRVQQLLHTRRIWAKMRGIRSSREHPPCAPPTSIPPSGQMYAMRKSDLKSFRSDSRSVCRIEDGSTNAYLTEERAIGEWDEDLGYLYKKFYVPMMLQFQWPTTL